MNCTKNCVITEDQDKQDYCFFYCKVLILNLNQNVIK